MANAISLTAAAVLTHDGVEVLNKAIASDLEFTVSGDGLIWHSQQIGTSEEAIDLGGLSTLGWAFFINVDPTNFIELRTGTGGTKFAKLQANGGFALLRLGSGITAPYAIADTAACWMRYAIVEV